MNLRGFLVLCFIFSSVFSSELKAGNIIRKLAGLSPSVFKDEKFKVAFSKFSEMVNHPKPKKVKEDTEDCGFCKGTASMIRELLLAGIGREEIIAYVSDLCVKYIIDEDICEGAISRYKDIVLDNLINRVFDPERTCVDLEYCDNKIDYIYIEDYAQRVLADKPTPIKKKIDESRTDVIKVLQVTDIHFDAKYLEGSVADCGRPICCRRMPEQGEQCIKAGFFGAEGKNRCDCNIEVVKAFAKQISTVDFDYMLLTGDGIVGEVWNLQQSDVNNAWKIFVEEVQKNIGKDKPIFPVIGNHEKYTVDQFHGNETELLGFLTDLFKQWLPQEALRTFKSFGYYSMNYKGIRIIALNCLMCDAFNWHLLSSTREPKTMFDWLENELANAERNGEPVHILDHMPIGNGEQNTQCTLRLKILFERYQNIIQAYISGHTHSDEIKFVTEYGTNKPFFVNWIQAGLTPESSKNPSFRVFEIDNETKLIKDFVQYRLDIVESNKDKTPHWKEYYRCYEFLNKTRPFDVEGITKINIEGDYVIHQNTDNEYGKSIAFDKENAKNIKCDMFNDLWEKRNECKGIEPGPRPSSDYLYHVLNVLSGNWTY